MPRNDYDFQDVFETMYGSDPTGGKAEIVTCSTRRAGEDDGQDGQDVELWGTAPVFYRPADPTPEGKCQVVTIPIGGEPVAIGSRDLRGAELVGALNKGDAAFGAPTGKVVYRSNADGSGMMFQKGDSSDAYIGFLKDGTIVLGNQYGQIELGPNGFLATTASGGTIKAGAGEVALIGDTVACQGGQVQLGVSAAVPLAVAPILPPGGTGFSVSKPLLNIFV